MFCSCTVDNLSASSTLSSGVSARHRLKVLHVAWPTWPQLCCDQRQCLLNNHWLAELPHEQRHLVSHDAARGRPEEKSPDWNSREGERDKLARTIALCCWAHARRFAATFGPNRASVTQRLCRIALLLRKVTRSHHIAKKVEITRRSLSPAIFPVYAKYRKAW